MIRRELANILTAYLMGWKTLRDLVEWLAGIDWEIPIDQGTQESLGCFALLSTEVLEGLRTEAELWQEATVFIASESGTLFIKTPSPIEFPVVYSSNDKAIIPLVTTFGQEPVVEESQSWSISPPLVFS